MFCNERACLNLRSPPAALHLKPERIFRSFPRNISWFPAAWFKATRL
jgi:hypothetical protein